MRCTRVHKQILYPAGLIAMVLIFILYQIKRIPSEYLYYHDLILNQKYQNCTLQKLNPWDPSIAKYIVSKRDELNCKKLQDNLSHINSDGWLVLDVKKAADLACEFRSISHDSGVGDDKPKYGEWLSLKEKVKLTTDFVEVSCRKSFMNVRVYHHFLSHILPVSRPITTGSRDDPSVIILGIDSISTSNMIRQLPKTLAFLKSEMGSYIFNGHTKIGDNTWINSLAMLAGKYAESRVTDVGAPDVDTTNYDRFFDDYAPYIWRDFAKKNYVTFFAEDRPDINNFNYAPKRGFKYQPTSHYMRPFWLGVHWSGVNMRSSAFCYNNEPHHKILLEYLRQFMTKYHEKDKNIKKFAFLWWQNLSHEFLNTIGLADEDLLNFLKSIRKTLTNTIFILLSDHGHRYDAIRESIIGRLEARMPFFSIAFPPSFKKRHPILLKNIQDNTQRLTSQFDVYGTLLDIVDGRYTDLNRQLSLKSRPYIQSLFRPISTNRTCYDAHIPNEFCPCYQEHRLVNSDPIVHSVSNFLVAHLNTVLKPVSHLCARLSLSKVMDAHVFLPNQQIIKDPQVQDKTPLAGYYLSYRVQIQTLPGNALLEAVIKKILDDGTMLVVGDIERNNKYGNTSSCVKTDYTRKKFCYCL